MWRPSPFSHSTPPSRRWRDIMSPAAQEGGGHAGSPGNENWEQRTIYIVRNILAVGARRP